MSVAALFDEPESDFSAAVWRVREVTPETTRRWVTQWHYSRCYPGTGTVGYGVFAPDLVCLITISGGTNAFGVARKFGLLGFPGNWEISRVVAHPSAPKNTASRAIASCYPMWHARGWDWLFSYADTGQGHHGGIYQALNAVYVGKSAAKVGFLAEGKPVHPRTLVTRYKTQAWPAVRDLAAADGVILERVEGLNSAKHTYILPIGPPSSRRAIRAALGPHIKTYPKREITTT